jgi:cytochrome c oxidase cbb3-type subunit 2
LIAGVFFFLLAIMVEWTLPLIIQQREMETVRTLEGELIRPVDYTPQEKLGRAIYMREGCLYCHSQYIRPVTGEDLRWGPVSQRGEYAYDIPHLFGTRRIGPDLTRVGRKYGDDWHFAHHWDPRHVVPDSIMPSFPWLFEGQGAVKNAKEAPRPTEEGKALIAYLQKLGTQIGDWRERFQSTSLTAGSSSAPSNEMVTFGKKVYQQRCIGCHGIHGDGKGLSAPFLDPKPRDFTRGIFKFRSVLGKEALPLDSDLCRTITHGLWGTAMPSWHEISEKERWGVIQYIKTFSDRWKQERPGVSVVVTEETPNDAASTDRGKVLFANMGCLGCHGPEGKGNGPLAPLLKDVWGDPVQPANLILPAGMKGGVKLGHSAAHIFTTIMAGVAGTPMESFAERLKPAEAWDVVHFVRSLREAAHKKEIETAKGEPIPLREKPPERTPTERP